MVLQQEGKGKGTPRTPSQYEYKPPRKIKMTEMNMIPSWNSQKKKKKKRRRRREPVIEKQEEEGGDDGDDNDSDLREEEEEGGGGEAETAAIQAPQRILGLHQLQFHRRSIALRASAFP